MSERGQLDAADASTDGRLRRSQRSREKILDAVAAVLEDPDLELTPERIAAGAGVSLSTIFRHFGDLDGLTRAMRERIEARVRPVMFDRPFEGGTRQRVRDLLRRRGEAFEILAPFQRAGLRNPRGGAAVRERQEQLRSALHAQLRDALGPELRDEGAGDRMAAIEALVSFEAWSQLRMGQGLATRRIEEVLEAAVLALLAADLD